MSLLRREFVSEKYWVHMEECSIEHHNEGCTWKKFYFSSVFMLNIAKGLLLRKGGDVPTDNLGKLRFR